MTAEETKKEEASKSTETAVAENEEVEVPSKFKSIVEEIEKMSVLDLSELVKIFEKKFGVSAQMMMAAAPAQGGGDSEGGKDEGSSEKTVELKSAGDQKIQVIKVIKEILNLGLKEAKELVDGAPKTVKENVPNEEAEEIKKKLEEAGATVELK